VTLRALYEIPAPAKLNLFLHVVGQRPDGYHLLESVFVLIDWCDTLHVELRADGQLRRHDLTEQLPADDLCLRAARALKAASGVDLGADITIAKALPSGAGMGGGSSDAASVLLALNRLWMLNWPRARLMPLAQSLGADVPFFVFGRNAWVQGIGEQLTPLSLPPQRLAVLKPAASVATASIFGSPLLRRDTPSVILSGSLERAAAAGDIVGFGHNDLQAPAQAACDEVTQALRWMESRFGNSRMTGSGSAVFSRVGPDDPTPATWPDDSATALPDGWVGRLCRSLPEHPLSGWAD
jgi:4-diphosphocytidyl-2-C-methyl-D-erythritol kinase